MESIVTTVDPEGRVNIAPMGPLVNRECSQFTLRPFVGSTTSRNLRAGSLATINVVDDVLLVAKAALQRVTNESNVPLVTVSLDQEEGQTPSRSAEGKATRLRDACHWFVVRPGEWSDEQPRQSVQCDLIKTGIERPFFGWNRAMHAVLEAAILATRLSLISQQEVRSQLVPWHSAVTKTGGEQELAAWQYVMDYMEQYWESEGAAPT